MSYDQTTADLLRQLATQSALMERMASAAEEFRRCSRDQVPVHVYMKADEELLAALTEYRRQQG